jgi:hypothetical protein
MTRRSKPYFIALDNKQMFRIPAARWHQWVAVGLLILVTGRVAKPAQPGVVWLEDGELHYPPDPVAPWMLLNCRQIERHGMLDTRGPRLTPESIQTWVRANYRD